MRSRFSPMTIMTNVTISGLKAIFNVASCRNGAVHLPPPRCYCRRVMAHTDKQETSPLREAAGPTDPNQVAARDRRAARTGDLTQEDVRPVWTLAMGPGF